MGRNVSLSYLTEELVRLGHDVTLFGEPVFELIAERKLVKKWRLFRKPEHFLVLDGYDSRIHALYFCPQLYKSPDGSLVPLTGPEIGELMAQALENGAIEKAPWYEPADAIPKDPVIKAAPGMEFDSLVVDAPGAKANKSTTLRAVGSRQVVTTADRQ